MLFSGVFVPKRGNGYPSFVARKGVTIAHFTVGKNGVVRLIGKKKGGSMPLKDLSGKRAYDLDREDFEKLFCQQCH